MEVIYDKGSILITPETDFERSVMESMGPDIQCFHKHGASCGDYIGIKVRVVVRGSENCNSQESLDK